MLVKLIFVPPGGGEAEYNLDFDLPSVPQPGDYISIMRPNQKGAEDFIVRRTWWLLHHPEVPAVVSGDNTIRGSVREISVECEFAKGAYSGEEHLRTCEGFAKSGNLKEFDASAY